MERASIDRPTNRSSGKCLVESVVADPGSIDGIHHAVKEGRTDPRLILDACLNRIDAVEHKVQGWGLIERETAIAQAELLREEASLGRLRGPLHGIPVAIKDVIDVVGWPTRAGSRTRANIAPSAMDATVVAQLRAIGAIILGKAHTTEFAYFDGPPPTRNPHDLARTPGGSSSGPAAVVAAGMVPLSLGTQTAGSINRPAGYCGIAAFKPSTRSWPSFGIVPFAPSFDTPGVFGYRVADATAAVRVLMPPFLRDRVGAPKVVSELLIGIIDDPILDAASAAVSEAIKSAVEKLRASGARALKCRSPVGFGRITAWHEVIIEYELARAHGNLQTVAEGEVTPALREAVARGRRIDERTYGEAWRALAAAGEQFWAAMHEMDALIFPTAPDVAPPGTRTGDPRFVIPLTALGGPIISVPVGFDRDGMPLGLMLTSAPGTDGRMVEIGNLVARVIEVPR
jgi:aspartyl-tRNA(Asn)/glutamyl-tRNA(Gln) amidotransferase subunit A